MVDVSMAVSMSGSYGSCRVIHSVGHGVMVTVEGPHAMEHEPDPDTGWVKLGEALDFFERVVAELKREQERVIDAGGT